MIESSHHSHDAALSAVPPTSASAVAAATLECHLLFIPDVQQPHWLLWGRDAKHSPLAALGTHGGQLIVDQQFQLRRVRGFRLPFRPALEQLATIRQIDLPLLPPSIAVWSVAAKFGLELVAREQFLPSIYKHAGVSLARWRVVLNQRHDLQRFEQLAHGFPVAAHALPLEDSEGANKPHQPVLVWSAGGLLRDFLDAVVDQLVRAVTSLSHETQSASMEVTNGAAMAQAWPNRWRDALVSDKPEFSSQGFTERALLNEVQTWLQPFLVPVHKVRLFLDLAMPSSKDDDFLLSFGLESLTQSAVSVSAHELFAQGEHAAQKLGCEAREAHEYLLQMLTVAARNYRFIEAELRKSRPESLRLKPRMVFELLQQLVALEQSGIVVRLPQQLQSENRAVITMQMRIGADADLVEHHKPLRYYWRAELAGQSLSLSDVSALLEMRTPLAYFNNRWVILNQRELLHAQKLLKKNEAADKCKVSLSLAMSLILTESFTQPDSALKIHVMADGALVEVVQRLRTRDAISMLPVPGGLHAELRQYQRIGMSWLVQMSQMGLGACLADDMGLGKTLQWLAYLQHRRERHARDDKPVLLVCPTSVIGHWEREVIRFVPELPLLRHYGLDRLQNAEAFRHAASGKLVITSYGLLRRDLPWLKHVEFASVTLDEAQFIKNSTSATAHAARALRADERIA